MHYWGDGFQYFAEVDRAAREIGLFCRKWGRIQVRQAKEKYGTARVYCSLSCETLHQLIWPGYHYIQYLSLYTLLTFPILRFMNPVTVRWQRFIYRLAYKRALKKYPMIKEEILIDADWPEYLTNL